MAINPDVQAAYKAAYGAALDHLNDTFDVGALSGIRCTASVIEITEEDPGGGDRTIRVGRIECLIDDLTAGVPALHTPLTYQGVSYQIAGRQPSDDGVTITFSIRQDL